TIRIQAHQIKSVAGGRPTLLVQDRPVPVLSLCDLLYHQSCDDSDEQQIVLIGRGQRLCALRVEKVIAQAQVVVKPLGRLLSRLRYYTGAAVLGDGELGLILDASYLINEAGRNTSWAA
ncbi:MAG: chemotaxis protein CheW, partial [Planctomycetota bacterium]